jgi:hypothetical protein
MSERKVVTRRSDTRRLAAQTVRQAREALGLTQEATALRYSVGVRTLRDIEAGKARMTALELVIGLRLAAAGPPGSEVHHVVPLDLVRTEQSAHGGPVRTEDSKTASASQRDESPAALTRIGVHVLPSAHERGAKAGGESKRPAGAPSPLVRRTDGVAAVAQPGSAHRVTLGEVAGSNPVSVSALFFRKALTECTAPQAAPLRPCTDSTSEGRQCSVVCGISARGVTAEAEAKAA